MSKDAKKADKAGKKAKLAKGKAAKGKLSTEEVEALAGEALDKLSASQPQVTRQTLGLPGGACDMRIGRGALDRMGYDVRGTVGKPRLAFVLAGDAAPKRVLKEVRRQLVSEGFSVEGERLADDASARTPDALARLYEQLDEAGITSDDLIVAIGGPDVLSLACHAASRWCSGTTLVHVPCDVVAALEVAVSPRGLDVGEIDQAVLAPGHPRMVIADLDVILDQAEEQERMACVLMAQSAILDNAGAFERLAGRAEQLLEGDVTAWSEQIADTAKARARITSSSSLVVRRGLSFGLTTARALRRLLPKAGMAELLAEGLRFESRLAVVIDENADVDNVFALDALLDSLGLEELPCKVKPKKLARALRDECMMRMNRFQLPLPLRMGRVRITAIDDDVLLDHAEAWCEAHADM